MAAKHLFTASALGLFAQLGGSPLPLAQLAERCGIPSRSTRILADAMVGLGFLDKADAGYANRPVAQSFLAGDPGEGLRRAQRRASLKPPSSGGSKSTTTWSGHSRLSTRLRNTWNSMHAWLARYSRVAALSHTTWRSVPPCFFTSTVVTQSG